jgi:adenine-specific DNA-methyltransferase
VTKELTKKEKKDYGIFITPKVIIEKLTNSVIKIANDNNIIIKDILEPSCGTCEFVNYIDVILNDIKIDAVEYNFNIFKRLKNLKFKNDVNLINNNFIKFDNNINYSLIIGNPPYFVCKKEDVPQEYKEYISGRPNIFGLFILHSLLLLKNDGLLAFIVPKSFLNSIYYSKIRNYIKKTCEIMEIIDFELDNEFIDTEQATLGLILKKNNTNNNEPCDCKYSMDINGDFIFTTNYDELKSVFEGSTTLIKMGLRVRTGNIVWNEHKEKMTNDSDETLLIYNTNITKNNELEIKSFKNDEKKQYIKLDGRIDTVMVVNRGNGNSKYKLNYAIIDKKIYLIENHLNEIYASSSIKKDELINIFNKISQSFKNPKTQKFIDLFLGNNGLSKTELETIFPIYL